jgi:hypothetical protein
MTLQYKLMYKAFVLIILLGGKLNLLVVSYTEIESI